MLRYMASELNTEQPKEAELDLHWIPRTDGLTNGEYCPFNQTRRIHGGLAVEVLGPPGGGSSGR